MSKNSIKQRYLFVVTVNYRARSVFTDKNKAYKELCNHMFFWEMPYTKDPRFQKYYDNGQYKEALMLAPSGSASSAGFIGDNFESDLFNVAEVSCALDSSEYEN